MGDVVQPISMERLLASVAPPGQCFYYAYPTGESTSSGRPGVGEFFGGDEARLIALSEPDAWKVGGHESTTRYVLRNRILKAGADSAVVAPKRVYLPRISYGSVAGVRQERVRPMCAEIEIPAVESSNDITRFRHLYDPCLASILAMPTGKIAWADRLAVESLRAQQCFSS